MSELSENTGSWPKNPYELLGVEECCDKKTLKRAYNKLIRRFKPDHFPEQFRRIREAYDEILEEMDNPFLNTGGGFSIRIDETVSPLSVDSEVNKLWELAEDGREDEALEQFYILELNPGPEETLKFYWLSKIQQEPQDKVFKLLTESLLREFDYRVLNVLLKEMKACPDWSLSDQCLDLSILITKKETEAVHGLLDARWEAAWLQEQYKIICSDTERLRYRLPLLPAQDWTLILLRLHNYLSFADFEGDEELLKKYHEEVEGTPVLSEGFLQDQLDNYDYLRDVRWAVRHEKNLPDQWRKIISGYWAGVEKSYSALLREEMVGWVINPGSALDCLSKISPKNKEHLYTQVRSIVYTFSLDNGPYILMEYDDAMADRCVQFLSKRANLDYQKKRVELLEFCLNQDVPPDALHSFVMQFGNESHYWLLEMGNDLHQAVFMACKSLLSFAEFNEETESA